MQITLLSADEINVPHDLRVRKKFPSAESVELADDIIRNGLYHAPVVTPLKEGETTHQIVAGHRRLIAIRNIYKRGREFTYNSEPVPAGMVPVTLAQNNDPITLKEIELHENIKRLDLTWQERDAAVAELHELRTGQNPKQTFKDTAKEIAGEASVGRGAQRVSDSVIRYKHRDDPDVAAAQTEKEALKIILRKHEETIRRGTIRTSAVSPHRLIQGNALTVLPQLPADHFTAIVTDPPYGIDADKFGDAANLRHRYADSDVAELYQVLFEQAARILKPDAHIYVFCDIEQFSALQKLAETHSFKPWRTPLIWDKGSRGHLPSGGASGWRRSYETIFHATRGARVHTTVANDVIQAHWIEDKIHAAQKPAALYHRLLTMSAYAGEHVLDPFCGAGPIFRAAKQASMKATGIELDKEWIKHVEAFVGLTHEPSV